MRTLSSLKPFLYYRLLCVNENSFVQLKAFWTGIYYKALKTEIEDTLPFWSVLTQALTTRFLTLTWGPVKARFLIKWIILKCNYRREGISLFVSNKYLYTFWITFCEALNILVLFSSRPIRSSNKSGNWLQPWKRHDSSWLCSCLSSL